MLIMVANISLALTINLLTILATNILENMHKKQCPQNNNRQYPRDKKQWFCVDWA